MGRPPLPLGTYGEIRIYQLGPKRYRARTKYRDYDGAVREVEKVGTSKTNAADRLKEALRDRARAVAGDDVHASSKVREVAEIWLRELDESDKALRTKNTYHQSWDRDLKDAVADLRISECTVSLTSKVLRSVHESAGPGSAKHAKVVLSGILGVAVRFDALETNPVREVVLPRKSKKKAAAESRMVLTVDELPGLRSHLRSNAKWGRWDLPDLIDVLSALGCRIGELLALDWTKVDFEAGTLAIKGTVIREPGVGLFVQPHTKSTAGMRTISPPAWAMRLLRGRAEVADSEWVFPSATGTLRDPDNTRADIRSAVAGTSWEGLHPHAFRHLVATEMDKAGKSAREIADYLGHEKVSMTQDVYMDRKSAGGSASEALDKLDPGS
ncbi:site-specific integrase [Saccharopolyspora flava]|uniref:Phage integrase family protein n=1 Tax=Saccharopolyspora flava TaxID=95161 RepID=A0A1I6TZB5_9PSEU|nr:site-specific integrase [Saccharopolyspora flava]SFS94520.1 Phage integrase family protein [Saccharopolyspora flava]